MKQTQLHDYLTDWIDTSNIADQIIQAMNEVGLELTKENAEHVWLSMCTHMPTHFLDYGLKKLVL